MITLQEKIDDVAKKVKEDQLTSAKLLFDFEKLTFKEYVRIIKRIHLKRQNSDFFGLEECTKSFAPVQIICYPSLELTDIKLHSGMELIGIQEDYG